MAWMVLRLTAGGGGGSVGKVMEPSLPGIQFACAGPTALFRISGRAAAERARDFDMAVRRMTEQGVREVHLDLGGCPLLDSTFSGTLAGLAEGRMAGGVRVQFVLRDARPRILDGLANLDVLPLFRVAEASEPVPEAGPMRDLPQGLASRQELGRFCLEAHDTLSRLSEANQGRFAELRRMLAEEVSRGEAAGAQGGTQDQGGGRG